MDYSLPPEEFIRAVLNLYLNKRWSVQTIAEYFDVGIDIINRILKQYKPLKEKPIQLIEDKTVSKKIQIKEMEDKVRQEKEKITEEDLKDLKLDIILFERGHEPPEV
jgi:Zn-dependent peptidase ImmA (M78 family)